MAVTMVIGNIPQIVASLFKPGATLASIIANEFNEATSAMLTSALFELGLVLLGVTVIVNALAQLLLKTFAGPGGKPQQVNMTAPNHRWRNFKNVLMQIIAFSCAILVVTPLVLVFYHLAMDGVQFHQPRFLHAIAKTRR